MYVNSSKYIMYVISPLSLPRLKMYIYIRDTVHCSLFVTKKSQTKQALLQLKARHKIYKGANRLGSRTGKWAKRHRGERKNRRNDSGVKRLRKSGRNDSGANGIVVKTTRIQVNVDTKRVPKVTKLGTK